MAGSFEIFRKYQRSLLVCVAILSMLAFFVLPPFLQMGGPVGAQDPVAVTWKGGEFRESDLERTVALRSVVNRFLAESAAAGGRDPSRLPLLPEGEEQTVQTALLAQEARENGVVVSDQAINDFLGQWTGNLVRQDQFDEILSRLRIGPLPLTQQDLFAALRVELAARTMLLFHQSAFNGDPPGWQWDYFRRLEQRAGIEVVPVVVEDFASEIPAPSAQTLRAFYEKYKDKLPEARSADPGFREPHRVRYEYVVAKNAVFEEEESKSVTDEQVAEYYEKNKLTMFRARPKPAGETPPDAGSTKPTEDSAKKPAESKPAESKPAEEKPAEPKAATTPGRFSLAAFNRADSTATDGDAATKPADKPAEAAPASAPEKPVENKPVDAKPADGGGTKSEKDQASPDAAAKPEEPQFEPLDAVKDEIRKRLARERADARIDAIFTAVAADIVRYAEDYALWQARRPAGSAAPQPPDVEKIAEKQGLAAGRSELVAADAAFAAGGIGGSFEFVQDPSSRFGIRQQRWIDQMFGSGALSLRPVRSRDVEGSRYLSWRTEDQPEFTPSFETAQGDVERAWRIVEARGAARKAADSLAGTAREKKTSLAQALPPAADGAKPRFTPVDVPPFSWLTAGMAGGGPSLSQPASLSMPGDEFMRAVFSLEPEQTAVAFNEPKTVCYAIRLATLEPPTQELQDRFLAGRANRQAIGMVAQREATTAFRGLIEGLERRRGLDWKRQPRDSR